MSNDNPRDEWGTNGLFRMKLTGGLPVPYLRIGHERRNASAFKSRNFRWQRRVDRLYNGASTATPRDFLQFTRCRRCRVFRFARTGRQGCVRLAMVVHSKGGCVFCGMQALGWEVHDAPGGAFMSKDGVTAGQAASMVFDPDRRVAIVAFFQHCPGSAFLPRLPVAGLGSADIARHLLRPQIPLDGEGGTIY